MKTFTLVNPLIIGSMKTEYVAENGLKATSQFWSELGTHLALNNPELYVTMKDDSGTLSHYVINEKLGNNKIADYTISEHKVELSKAKEEKFLKDVKKYEIKGKTLTGGSVDKKPKRDRSKDSSSSSDLDSDDDYYNFRRYRTRLNAPINMLYYTPLLYSVDTIVLPTFVPTVTPYVTLYFPVF